jgi:hypothetical protein
MQITTNGTGKIANNEFETKSICIPYTSHVNFVTVTAVHLSRLRKDYGTGMVAKLKVFCTYGPRPILAVTTCYRSPP